MSSATISAGSSTCRPRNGWWAACGRLTNDFFVNLLSMETVWRAQNDDRMVFDADRFDARRQLDPQ